MSSERTIVADAVVLAGQANQGPFRDLYPVPNEALIPAAGYPLLSWVLGALGSSSAVAEIIVVGPPGDLGPVLTPLPGRVASRVRLLNSADRITENIRIGVSACSGRRPILLATADVPLITPGMVDRFVAAAAALEADLVYPAATRDAVERGYPGSERTYVRVSGARLTGGNIFLARYTAIPTALQAVERFFANRKNPLKLASMLGPGFILGLLLGRIRIPDAERRVSDLVGAEIRVLITDDPELGLDVDKPSHLPPVERALAGLSPGHHQTPYST